MEDRPKPIDGPPAAGGSESFQGFLISYTNALENPGIDTGLLRRVLVEARLGKLESQPISAGSTSAETYVPLKTKSSILSCLAKHKLNSFAESGPVTGFYFSPITDYNFNIVRYRRFAGTSDELTWPFQATVVFWVDQDYISATLVLDGTHRTLTADELTKLQHPRGLVVDDQTVASIRGSSQLFSRLGDLRIEQRNLGNLIVELLLAILRSYYERKHTSGKELEKALEGIRQKSASTIRTSTFITTVTNVKAVENDETLNGLANVIGGYQGLVYRDTKSFVDKLDISETPDLRALIKENRFLVAMEPVRNRSVRLNTGAEDWLAWGILSGEVFASLMATQYRFHLRTRETLALELLPRTRRELTDMVVLSTRLSDPNYVQTPLLRRVLSAVKESNHLEVSLERMKDDLTLRHNISEAVSQKTISILILLATSVLLAGSLLPFSRADLLIFVGGAIISLVLVGALAPGVLARWDSSHPR